MWPGRVEVPKIGSEEGSYLRLIDFCTGRKATTLGGRDLDDAAGEGGGAEYCVRVPPACKGCNSWLMV